jgi:hypothetical protein
MNPIEAAVSPLRTDAVVRAETDATTLANRLLAELEAAGWDLNTVAPRPTTDMSRATYKSYQRRRAQFAMVARYAGAAVLRNRNSPEIYARDDERVAKFVQQCKEAAAASYDAFVAKLSAKIGDCTSATLSGNHVWGRSTLTVTKPDGATERWHTQQIVNQSVLGLLFNQWPTRKGK